jgi:hypothetical protein
LKSQSSSSCEKAIFRSNALHRAEWQKRFCHWNLELLPFLPSHAGLGIIEISKPEAAYSLLQSTAFD